MIHICLAPSGRARNALEDVIPGELKPQIKVRMPRWRDVPARADFVIHAGTGAPSSKIEHFTGNRGAMLVCLPEAYDWLQRRIVDAVREHEDLTLLDAGLLTMKVS